MSVTGISTNNKYLLWVLSAGRCQYRGCNKSLREDILTKKNFNQSYIAHIVADQPGGPRGDSTRSPQLADDITNLILLCDSHHRLVDKVEVAAHPESLLLEMKKEHEDRIKRNTDIADDMQSHIVTYKANIGNFTPNISYQVVSKYLLPNHYPAMSETIDLSTSNNLNRDNDPSYWSEEEANLERQFNRKLLQCFSKGEIRHISIFAIAPMPLLVKLGTLVNNIYPAEIHQKLRVPDTWNLSEANNSINYRITEPTSTLATVALNISLSANINNDRITNVLGTDCSIFTLTIDNPNTDFLQNKRQLADFGTKMQEVFNIIKSKYNSKTPLHIFPAMPVATAVEMGRVWMPKADMPMHLYDENTSKGGFVKAIQILNQ